MALIHCDFFSEALGLSTSMYVILPQETNGQNGMRGAASLGKKYPTLYLLHGLSDDHSIWMRHTSIERYVAPLGLAVVMPDVHRSYYTDMAYGGNYWTFVSEELPAIARSFFPLSDLRRDNFVAGLSMGGYGAFKMGLRCPNQFAAVASLSGALDVAGREEKNEELMNIFGGKGKDSENDLFFLAREVAKSDQPNPCLYQCCGTEDALYDENLRFLKHCRNLDYDVVYEEEPAGHEWAYWDEKIQRVLDWLPL